MREELARGGGTFDNIPPFPTAEQQFVASRSTVKVPVRFVRVEEHTVNNIETAANNVIRALNKPGRSNMLEAISMIIQTDPLDSPMRCLIGQWLGIIAAREAKHS